MVFIYFKSFIYNLNIIFNLFASLIILIVCDNFPNNTDKSALSTGIPQNIININGNLIICAYDFFFSNQVNINYNYTRRTQNFLCLLKNSTNLELYLINSEKNVKIRDLNNLSQLDNTNSNLIPYVDKNNNLKFLLIYFPNNSNIIKIYNNNLNSQNLESIDISIHQFSYHIGCGISDIWNKYLTCFFQFNNNSIFSYNFDIETNKSEYSLIMELETTTSQTINSSSFSINKEQNIFFICLENSNIQCFFYNSTKKSFTDKTNSINCDKKIKNYYFNETKEYFITCEYQNNSLIYKMDITNLNDSFKEIPKIIPVDKPCPNDSILYYNINEIEYELLCGTNKKNISPLENYYCYLYYHEEIYKSLDVILANIPYFIKDRSIPDCCNYFTNSDYNILIRPNNKTCNFVIFDTSDINFLRCESILKQTGSIRNTSKLTIFLLEIKNNNNISLNNKIEYKIYDEDYKEIDFSPCEISTLPVNFSLKENGRSINISLIHKYSLWHVNLFDIDGVFYHDLCQIYSDFKFDVIMEDRLKYLYQPYSICEEGCSFEDIDSNFVYCQCPFKLDINTNLPSITLGEKPTEFPKHYQVFKCFGLVFSSDDKINNFGFYLITFMLGGHVPIWCYYLSTNVEPIKNYIKKEMEKFGYLSKDANDKTNAIKVQKKNNKNKKNNKKKNKGTNRKINKGKSENKKDNSDSKKSKNDIEEPPKKKENKSQNVTNKKSSSKRKKKSNRTFIKSCFIISNNNINNDGIIREIKGNKNTKKVKGSSKIKTTISKTKKSKKTKKIKYDNSKDLIKSSSKSIPSPDLIETQNMEDYYYSGEEEERNLDDFNFININLDPSIKAEPRKESNTILNNYTYEEAIEYDKRSFCRIFYIFLLSKDIIFHSLILRSPFDSISVLGSGFIFFISTDFFFNCLFYFDEIVSKRFLYRENVFTFTFSTNMPNIFYSVFILMVFEIVILLYTNISPKIREIFQKEEEKLKSDKKYTVSEERKKEIMKQIEDILQKQNKKNYCYFVFELIIVLLYWYYITAFCHVYSNSQDSWVLNTIFTLFFCFLFNCVVSFVFSILYKSSIENKSQCLYNAALTVYNI